MHDSRVELYIDCGDGQENKRMFDALYERKQAIEEKFGGSLEWQRLDDRRACRICHVMPGSGLQEQDRWSELHEQMIDAMIRLERGLGPHIKRL
jgi:hypothetical protein